MKYFSSFVLLFFFLNSYSFLSKPETFSVPIKTDSTNAQIEVCLHPVDKKTNENKLYYWVEAKKMHRTRGAYSGKLAHGKFEEKFKNGRLKRKGEFKFGLKQGKWITWDQKGMITQIVFWNKGSLTKKEFYTSKGKLIQSIEYKDGIKHGKNLNYDASGNSKILYYKKGEIYTKKKLKDIKCKKKKPKINEESNP